MKLNTYVNFSGKCAEAFRYYQKHLGAKVGMVMTHAQSPSGGQVLMPIREEFFATRFGQVRDRFGINWMILHERPAPSQT
jgi:uncharacterized glyoxalase superfamily protein PhnB